MEHKKIVLPADLGRKEEMIPEKQFPSPHYPGLRDALSSPTSTHIGMCVGRSLCLILAMGPLEVLELSATATGQEKYLCC